MYMHFSFDFSMMSKFVTSQNDTLLTDGSAAGEIVKVDLIPVYDLIHLTPLE